MRGNQVLVAGMLAAAVGAVWYLSNREVGPRWQPGTYIGYGVTVADAQRQLDGSYLYWVSFEEVPGETYGPLTEEQVMAQCPTGVSTHRLGSISQHPHGEHDCYCPICGYREVVEEYVRCSTLTCPTCGERMRAVERGTRFGR